MKIAMVTIATPEIENYARFTRKINKVYAEEKGYSWVEYRQSLEPRKHIMWSKILALLENIKKFDYLLWIDSDAMVVNPDMRIESIILLDKDFHFCFDENGINAGVLLIKGGEYAENLLRRVYDLFPKFDSHLWKEQEAIKSLYYSDHEFTRRCGVLDKGKMNAYIDDYQPGDFILHMPGIAGDRREQIFEGLANAI